MELKEVIHYYIGQQCKVISVTGNVSSFLAKPEEIVGISYVTLGCVYDSVMVVKPILRKIDSLTDEEKHQILSELGLDSLISLDYFDKSITDIYCKPIDRFAPVVYFQAFHLLVKLGVDLFGLIDNNHAIDKAKL